MTLVVDAFPFFNEFAVLNARGAELTAVDLHLATEAPITYSGRSKPMYLTQWLRSHSWPTERAPLLVGMLDSLPAGPDFWVRERYQRDQLLQFIEAMAANHNVSPHDVMILNTDADEIVNSTRLAEIIDRTDAGPVALEMKHFYYRPDLLHPTRWYHPKACRLDQLEGRTLSQLRLDFSLPVVPSAGWHLGYFGDSEWLHHKIRSFAHGELDTPEFHAGLDEAVERGIVAHEGTPLQRVDPALHISERVLRALDERLS